MEQPLAARAGSASRTLPKAPTGIHGFDEITGGGLPAGRTSLVCGSAGCGKTLFALEFLVRGVTEFGEPGVCITFEETADDLVQNVRSLGFDLDQLVEDEKISIDYIRVDRSEIDEAGEYNLDGLFLRLGLAIDSVGAKRVVLDTIETLFGGFSNQAVLRSELRRLFGWLKERKVTTVITGERGDGQLTRQGLEEYVSDCVILLDHRVTEHNSTRRLRVVKYRGTTHGTNEYPFLIDESGFSVMPITSMSLAHEASNERISSGVPRLDGMLGGAGFYRGSSVLVSGTAGTGKTSLSGHFADATCRRGERCLYFAFEESQSQNVRNMASIGLNLQQWIDAGLLKFHATRPTLHGVEQHLALMHKLVREFKPQAVIVDPVSNFVSASTQREAEAMLIRLVDFLKIQGITAFFTSLTSGGHAMEATEQGLSSIVDTWLLLRDIELGGERNRGLYVLKSRGMAHSNQIREFLLTSDGIELRDIYLGPEGVLTGSMRLAQEARERSATMSREQEAERLKRQSERRRHVVEAQIAALKAELEADELEGDFLHRQRQTREGELKDVEQRMSISRNAESRNPAGPQ